MTKYFHIVQVHPVENGEPNLHKVAHEVEAETKEEADAFIKWYNKAQQDTGGLYKAVYLGCVNDETGELV